MEKDQNRKRRKKHHQKKTLLLLGKIAAVLAGFLLVIYAGTKLLLGIGGNRLYQNAESKGPLLESDLDLDRGETENKEPLWQEGWVRHKGEIYEYNDKILTFLVMGIDKKGEVTGSRTATDGGQSDALFLAIINPEDETLSILAIDRNTMTDIRMVGAGENGTDMVRTSQLAVQHGFGDGKEGSCELTRDAVSALFFDLPVHGYISVNYEAVPYINDAVGGVEVTIPKDALGGNPNWTEGEQVTLKGQEAISFIKWRDTSVFESARLRMLRQKQYLTAFVSKALAKTKTDVTLPLTLYQGAKNYIVTDLSVDEIVYLASEFMSYHFDGERIYTMEGETVMGEKYEEFYPDMEALKEQVITLFYHKVELPD